MTRPVLFLVGPTGSGKTQVSLCLAKRLGCEIISADSMLVYRGMDVGTAKPLPSERKKVRHHLMDIVAPRSNFSVHEHRGLALKALQKILKRKRIPLIVGGSGLYVDAIWKGLSPHPRGDLKLRRELKERLEKKGLEFLYRELKKMDPYRAGRIHPHDERRILRALEIAKLSGRPASEGDQKKTPLEDLGYSVKVYGIARDRAELYERINQRVQKMFEQGFFQEVKKLRRKRFSTTARQALGYRELLHHLKCGGKSVSPALIQEIQQKTRQFAKRQLTWFRREKEIHWIFWGSGETARQVCDKISSDAKSWLETEHCL